MADKAISELLAANQVTPTDLFVLEQSGTAKKLTGQVLENWLVSFADGHGGIQTIDKVSSSGLVDTYKITLADTTTFDFLVTNGKSINSITKTKTSGLVDTYTIDYNDGTKDTYTVTNGAKGDKGDNTYTWIKYASQQPTASSHSFGDLPDDWIGIYAGASDTAPTDWQEYSWFQIKGEKGDTGDPATVTSNVVEYQVGDSGTIIPSGVWGSSVPVVPQGKYLWTRTTTTFNSGSSSVAYSVSRMGLDGAGSVSSVANISPDANGNVPLNAESIGARPNTWMPTASDVGAIGFKRHLTSSDNLDTIKDDGIYVYTTNSVPKNCPYANAGIVLVFGSNSTTSQKIQFVFRYGITGCGKFRVLGDGWLAWTDLGGLVEDTTYPGCYYRITTGTVEWESPPMIPGVEYRTTERYKGKTVYAYSVEIGALPASGSTTFYMTPTSSDKVDKVLDFQMYATNDSRQYPFPFISNSGAMIAWCRLSGDRTVYVNVSDDISAYNGYGYFKYTKK